MKDNVQFKAGAGKAELRFPNEMFPTDGFCKVHDYSHIRVLLMESNIRFAIVAVELVVTAKPFVAEIKKIVNEITGIELANIWVHSTHVISTPHAPGPKMKGPPDKRPPISEEDKIKRELFTETLNQAAREATEKAWDSVQPAAVGYGAGKCSVTTNLRNLEAKRGFGTDLSGKTNDVLSVLRFDSMSGEPIGFVMICAIKPNAIDNAEMTQGTRQVSSDLPGKACTVMEEALGAPVLFCTSGAGDHHPIEAAYYAAVSADGDSIAVDLGVEKGLEIVERLGTIMGEEGIAVAKEIECNDSTPVIGRMDGAFTWKSKPVGKGPVGDEMVEIPVFTASIGDIALVATMPEINSTTELELQAASPFETTLLLTMVNGPMKYMPEAAAYENNTAEAKNSFVVCGAAEKFVETAVEMFSLF